MSSHKIASQIKENRYCAMLKERDRPYKIKKELDAVNGQIRPIWFPRYFQIRGNPHQDKQNRPHDRKQPARGDKSGLLSVPNGFILLWVSRAESLSTASGTARQAIRFCTVFSRSSPYTMDATLIPQRGKCSNKWRPSLPVR